jgi:hypothetical protein
MRRLLLLAALAAAGCGSEPRTEVPVGQWGGRNVDMQVGDTGASAAFKCGATGILDGRLELDASGHFEANGTYLPVVIAGGARPAHYVGSVSGGTMTLSVTTGAGEIGSFQLTHGAAGAFDVCNF